MDPSLHPYVNRALLEARQESLRRLALPMPPSPVRPVLRQRLGLSLIQFGAWLVGPPLAQETRRPVAAR